MFIGLLVGLVLGIHWCFGLDGYYDVMSVMGNEAALKALTWDGVFVGSLTFAGLAMFGFTILGKALALDSDNKQQRIGSMLVIGGTLFIIILYVRFAFQSALFTTSMMADATMVLVIVIMAGAVLLAPKRKEPANEASG